MPHTWIEGPIPLDRISPIMEEGMKSLNIGAQAYFYGQIRADKLKDKTVRLIEYTAYKELANKEFERLENTAESLFELQKIYIFHSLGKVAIGEWSMVVIVFSKHRKAAFQGLEWLVNHIKSEIPIFGKEILEDGNHQWKVNQ